jgi:7tm Odorant receptor.
MKKSCKIVEPTECLDVNLTLLKFCSLFPLDQVSSSMWMNTLYKGYTTFTVTLFFSVSVAAPLFIFCTDYSLEDGIEVMSILLTQVRSGMKIMTFVIYREEVQKLIRALYENFYVQGTDLTAHESSIISERVKYARKISIGYFSLYCTTALAMVLHPLTSVQTDQAQEDAANLTGRAHRNLPFKSWYPNWDSTESPQYEIEYSAQATLTVLEAWMMGSIDSFCVTLMIYVGCQFDLLGISLRKVSNNALFKIGTAVYRRGIQVSYPTKPLTLNKRPTFFVVLKKGESKEETDVNDNDSCNLSDESAFRDNYTQFGWKEVNHMVSIGKSYKEVEKETMLYIKQCIRCHQSLLM